MQSNIGFGRRFMFYIANGNGNEAMKEIKHKGYFIDDESFSTGAGYCDTITLDNPGVGNSNYLVGAVFHHAKAGVAYQVDYALSKDGSESRSILLDNVKSDAQIIVNCMQGIETSGFQTDMVILGQKGIKLPDDDVVFMYGQRSVGTETNILHGVDVYYIEDTT